MSTFLDEMQPNFYMKFRPRIPMKQNPRAYWKYIILSVMYHIRCNKRKDLWALALSNNVVILNKIRQLKDVTSIVNYNFIDNTNDSDGNNTGNSYNDTDNDNDNDTNSYLLESYEKLSPLEQLELEVNVLRKEDDSLKTMVQSLSRQKVQLEASDFRSGDSITSTYSNSNSKTREISNSVIVEENKQIGTKKNSNGQNSSTSLAKNKVIGRISSSNSIQKLKVYTENHVEEISLQNKSSPSKSNKVLPEYNKQTSTSDSTVVNGDYRSQDEEDSIADKHSVSSTHVSRESLVNTNNRNSKSFLRSEDQRPTLSKQFSPKEKKSSKVLPAPAPSPYIRLLPDNNLSQLDEALKNIRDSKEITVDHHNVTNASDNHTVHHSVSTRACYDVCSFL